VIEMVKTPSTMHKYCKGQDCEPVDLESGMVLHHMQINKAVMREKKVNGPDTLVDITTTVGSQPFYFSKNADNVVDKIYFSTSETIQMVDLKRSIANIFHVDMPPNEMKGEEMLQHYAVQGRDPLGSHTLAYQAKKRPDGSMVLMSTMQHATGRMATGSHGDDSTGEDHTIKTDQRSRQNKRLDSEGELMEAAATESHNTKRMTGDSTAPCLKESGSEECAPGQDTQMSGNRMKLKSKSLLEFKCVEYDIDEENHPVPDHLKTHKCGEVDMAYNENNPDGYAVEEDETEGTVNNSPEKDTMKHGNRRLLRKTMSEDKRRISHTSLLLRSRFITDDRIGSLTKKLYKEADHKEMMRTFKLSSEKKRAGAQQKAILLQVVDALNKHKRVQKMEGRNSEPDAKLKDMLHDDKDGSLHREVKELLQGDNTSVKVKEGTRARLIANMMLAKHGGSQAVILEMLQDEHAVRDNERGNMMLMLATHNHIHPNLRAHLEQQHEHHRDRALGHALLGVISAVTSRDHVSHPKRLAFRARMAKVIQSPKTSISKHILALSALGNIGDRQDIHLFAKSLAHEDERVRHQAARSLRKVSGRDVNQLLVQSVITDPADTVKSEAVKVLLDHRHVSPKSWEAVVKALNQNQTPSQRFADELNDRLQIEEKLPVSLVQVGVGEAINASPCTTCNKCLQIHGRKADEDTFAKLMKCSCAGQRDRVKVPGSYQFFEPKFKRFQQGFGNKDVGGGVYAEAYAEACRAEGDDKGWSGTISGESGYYVDVLGEHLKILATGAKAMKDTTSGWGGVGPFFIVMNYEIKISEFDHDDNDRSASGVMGGFNIDSCDGVTPFVIIPFPFGKTAPGIDKVRRRKGAFQKESSSSKSGLDFSYEQVFRIAYIVEVTLGFSTGFSLGVFVEPCNIKSGAAVAGLDPAYTGAISVRCGIDLLVASAGVGIDLTLFELHFPPFYTFWTDKSKNSVVCPQVHNSMELQLSWYLLAGKFYVYVTVLFVTTYPLEYYFPSKNGVNSGSW